MVEAKSPIVLKDDHVAWTLLCIVESVRYSNITVAQNFWKTSSLKMKKMTCLMVVRK